MTTRESERRIQLLGFFYEESSEGLQAMEDGLLSLDLELPDAAQIDSIFRAIHNIKGSGGSFGLDEVSAFAHHAETLLDEVRNETYQLDQQAVELLLAACDCLREMIDANRQQSPLNTARIDALAGRLQEVLVSSKGELMDACAVVAPSAPEGKDFGESTPRNVDQWHIRFAPHRHLLRTGNEPLRILRVLGSMCDSMQVTVDAEALPGFNEIEPEDCYLAWEVALRSDVSEETLREVFDWVEEDCDLEIVSQADRGVGDAIVRETDTVVAAESAPAERDAKSAQSESWAARGTGSIRVSTDKIDALVDMLGELVITQSMLVDVGEHFNESSLAMLRDGLNQLALNTRELQDSVMRIRMLPMSMTFSRFPRLIHDLSQKLGKQVDLVVSGEGTELDKTVLEKIGDPLVHLIRNSLDHGLETPEDRLAAGKPATGTIHLDAYHQGGNIVIDVRDDGAGLNPARIRAKAIERGLIHDDDDPTDSQLFELLFQAGFSTAQEVNDISGRGVGLDVVRRNIKELGGSIEVESETGSGTAFKIRLPLTLAIVDGQLVRVGSETYIVPLISIVESIQIKSGYVTVVAGRSEIYRLRDEAIPIVRLYEVFGMVPDRTGIEDGLLVVVEAAGDKVGLLVDELLGQQQVVVKNLKENYGEVAGISGATILGDGVVALIVDTTGLIDLAKRHAFERSRRMQAASSPMSIDIDAQGDSP